MINFYVSMWKHDIVFCAALCMHVYITCEEIIIK